MTDTTITADTLYTKRVSIQAPPAAVWHALVDPVQMQQWMSETAIDIVTDWQIDSPITITGRHYKMKFETWGRVLKYQPNEVVEYTHLSSLSRLKNEPGNHSILLFTLQPVEDSTLLTLTIRNFPTYAIYKHLAFYWMVTLEKIKNQVEGVTE